jgi:hypothetical protein
MKKVKVTELFRQPFENNCFKIEKILPDGNTRLLRIITYNEESETTDVWGREVNLEKALEYAKKVEGRKEEKSSEIIYQTPEND